MTGRRRVCCPALWRSCERAYGACVCALACCWLGSCGFWFSLRLFHLLLMQSGRRFGCCGAAVLQQCPCQDLQDSACGLAYDNVSGLCVVGACLEATASSLCRPGSSCPRCSSIRSPVQLLSYLLEVARLLYQLVLFQHLKHRQCIHL